MTSVWRGGRIDARIDERAERRHPSLLNCLVFGLGEPKIYMLKRVIIEQVLKIIYPAQLKMRAEETIFGPRNLQVHHPPIFAPIAFLAGCFSTIQ